MKKSIILIFIAVTLIWGLSCKNDKTNHEQQSEKTETSRQNETDYDLMATELCNCLSDMANISKKIKEFEAKGENIEELMANMQDVMEKSNKCVEELEKKYGDISGKNESKAQEAFKRICPEIAEMLEN